MQLRTPITTGRLVLRSLSELDATEDYLRWMKDPLVNRYLESRLAAQTLASIREFVHANNVSLDTLLLGIFLEGRRHIGNIKLGPIHSYHRSAAVGIMIGERDTWGKGYAAEAIGAISRYAFESLNLEKPFAGNYASNQRSYRAFLKAGFTLEGLLRSQVLGVGKRDDDMLVGLTRTDWMARRT
jgi:RimJ/RimL family protein N-acetyltransferase